MSKEGALDENIEKVPGTAFFGLVSTTTYKFDKFSRTELHSANLSVKNVVISLVSLLALMIAEAYYKEPLLDFTLSDDGIIY